MRVFVWLFFIGWVPLAMAQPAPARFDKANSALDEQNPLLSPDGRTLYFTISNHPQNVGGTKDLGDIWYATLTEQGWGDPIHGGTQINNALHNTVAGFSADGTQLFLMGHYAAPGEPVQSQGLAVARWNGTGWATPVNIKIPYFKNSTLFQSGCLSADGNVLVFSAESYATRGAEDIYVSLRSAGKWSEPKNLGNTINTPYQDVSPSLSPDGRRLYFASNGHGGYGSFDVFFSDRLDDTWLSWSEPVNAGPDINSEGRELFYRPTPWGDFYTSTRNSDGYGDIHFYQPPTPKDSMQVVSPLLSEIKTAEPTDSVTKQIIPIDYAKEAVAEAKSFRVWGTVLNAQTQAPLLAQVHILSTGEQLARQSKADGMYEVTLAAREEYHIKVEAPGFIGVMEKLDLRTQVLNNLEMNFQLQPVAVGTTVNLKSVLFQQSTATLLKESYDELNMVADFMKQNPKVEIELAGHTDNRGYHQLNMKLSRERVEEVKKYLVAQGIESRRISGKGYGGTKPIADNDAEETRALNRRVEFTIVKD